MTIGSSSQNPRFAMERDQPATRLEVHELEESDARQSAHGNTRSRRSRSSSRKISQIQEVVLRREDAAQRSQDTLDNMIAMMRWQVNMQFRKDREDAIARNPNPDLVVQQLDLPFGPPPGFIWPYQKNPLIAQIAGIPEQAGIQDRQRGEAFVVQEQEVLALAAGPTPVQAPQNQQELLPLHPEVPCNQPAAHLPEQQMVLPYKTRRMDPHPFPPLPRGKRGK